MYNITKFEYYSCMAISCHIVAVLLAVVLLANETHSRLLLQTGLLSFSYTQGIDGNTPAELFYSQCVYIPAPLSANS